MANIEKFCELLRKGNPTMTFEIESDSPYSGVKWIVYRKGDINSVNLPKGATLIDCRTVKYNGFTFHMIPMTEKVIGQAILIEMNYLFISIFCIIYFFDTFIYI